MKDSTKRILLIGASVLVLGGVAYYFLVYRKRSQGTNAGTGDQMPPDQVLSDEPSGTTPVSSTQIPDELNTVDKIKAFQDWMDTVGPWVKGTDGKYRLLNKGAGYGNYGPSTRAAWKYYKSQYLNPTSEATVAADEDLKNAINYLMSTWAGDKTAFRKRLLTEKRGLVLKWADAVRKFKGNQLPKNSFEFEGRIYDVIYGKQRISVNPIGKTAKAFRNTAVRQTPSASATKTNVLSGANLGAVADYRWNKDENLMYLFVPNNGVSTNNKWAFLGNVSL